MHEWLCTLEAAHSRGSAGALALLERSVHVAKTFVLVSTTDVYGDVGAHCSASSSVRCTSEISVPRLASGAAGGSEEDGLLPTLPSAMVAAALELRLRVRPSFSAPRAQRAVWYHHVRAHMDTRRRELAHYILRTMRCKG